MKRPNLTQNKILLLLAVGLLAAMVVSVTQERYLIGLKELGGILVSRLYGVDVEVCSMHRDDVRVCIPARLTKGDSP